MPEETKTDGYQSALEKLVDFKTFNKSHENYVKSLSKKDGTGLEDLALMGQTRDGFNSDTFLNETPAAIDNEARVYVTGRTPEMKTYVETYKPQIISDYTKNLDSIIQNGIPNELMGIAEIRKKIADKVKPEDQKKAFEQNLPTLYQNLGMILSDLTPNKDYEKSKESDKEVVEALKGIKELKDITNEESKEKVSEYMEEHLNTSSNFKNFRVDWNGIRNQRISQYMRLLGKKALKQNGDNYEVDKDFIAKVYGGYEGVLDMTPLAKEKK